MPVVANRHNEVDGDGCFSDDGFDDDEAGSVVV